MTTKILSFDEFANQDNLSESKEWQIWHKKDKMMYFDFDTEDEAKDHHSSMKDKKDFVIKQKGPSKGVPSYRPKGYFK